MLKSYPDIDVKKLCKETNSTLEDIGVKLGLSRAAISKRTKGQVVNKGFVEMCDALGYDIEIKYVKK